MTPFEALKHLVENEGKDDGIIEDDLDGATFTHWREGDKFFHERHFLHAEVMGPHMMPALEEVSTFRRVRPKRRRVRLAEAIQVYAAGEPVWM